MIQTKDAIAKVRALLGTPYAQLDCINETIEWPQMPENQ